MKFFYFAAFLLLFTLSGFTQKTVVTETEQTINGVPRKGQQISIQLDAKLVEKAWESYLKEKVGKLTGKNILTSNKGIYTIEQGKIEAVASTPLRIVSKVDVTEGATLVWWSLDMGSAYVNKDATPQQYEAAETILRDFARKLYREDVARQVLDAEKVLANTQAEELRVIKAADEIKRNIEKNKQRRIELEAELAQNAQQLTQLNLDTENNIKQQATAKQNVDNMRQAVEVVKNKVNLIE
ncbi:DNA repair ATPase [Adhaeribacter sp. BT258]|uniref:DNA repair ATPase n=1 Tax=Adhaeribacter terrigena TaxID=2793070 RepID=A0ABS1BX20_9BACT|nr:DNA repair ATPase [Adhaeribacter terrigena]MBK0401683.1 DNA repair ATPase [Adhaeribacter terrigena]